METWGRTTLHQHFLTSDIFYALNSPTTFFTCFHSILTNFLKTVSRFSVSFLQRKISAVTSETGLREAGI